MEVRKCRKITSTPYLIQLIILILNTIPKTINYNLDTMVTKKSSTPPYEVFNWDSPKGTRTISLKQRTDGKQSTL